MRPLLLALLLVGLPGCGKAKVPLPAMDWVAVPAGSFAMGSPHGEAAERPVHEVHLSGFEIGRTETTVGQYRACVAAGVCSVPDVSGELCSGVHKRNNTWLYQGADRVPVNCVDWAQSDTFCRWVGGALPTEAQWERAARAGNPAPRYGPLDDIAWHAGNAAERVHPVASRKANALGLYDMIGNLWEWTADYYAADWYGRSPSQDPTGPEEGERRVSRGGGLHMMPKVLRAAYRHDERPDERFYFLGFRCARQPRGSAAP